MGLGRLGFVADLLSSEVQVGYMNGLAITIIVGQLPKLCGFSTDATSFGGEVVAWFEHLDETDGRRARRRGRGARRPARAPSASRKVIPAVLVAVVGATVVSALLGLSDTHRDRRHAAERLPEADGAVDIARRRRGRSSSRRSGSRSCR